MKYLRRTWAEINLNAIEHNYRVIREKIDSECKLMCVIKADGYGHGSIVLAKEYERLGADWFAVSNIEEAIQLRQNGISVPILVLGYTPASMADKLNEFNVTQAVLTKSYAEYLSDYSKKYGVNTNVHIKLDTGMSRIGLMYQNPERDACTIDEIEEISKLENLNVTGMFSHFAVADDGADGEEYTMQQLDCFNNAAEQLKARGIEFENYHISNSGGIIDYKCAHLNMVRAGIILYGLLPSAKLKNDVDLMNVMELKSVISQIKTVEPDTTVSYGRTYTTQKPTTIATVPIGYADGYIRTLGKKAEMLVHGKRAKVVGRICMDQLMLDVTHIDDIKVGDIITVFGKDHGAYLTVDEIASWSDTINYEVICLVGKRVPRLYYRDGKIVDIMDICNLG
ncbi:MAG: alanine racemase [Acutalibacteraceae bacterium]